MYSYNRKSLLDICLDLHMNITGASDTLSSKEFGESYLYIVNRVDNWKPSTLPLAKKFDNAVKDMAIAVIEEYKQK